MNNLKYIHDILKNEESLIQIKKGNLILENELINQSFINKWNSNKLDIEFISQEEMESINFLYKVSNIFTQNINKLEEWNIELEYFFKTAKQDIVTMDKEYKIHNNKNIRDHEIKMKSIRKQDMSHELVDNKNNKIIAYTCVSIEKSNDLVEFEKKYNYVLKNIFSSMYFKFDELCSIPYFMALSTKLNNISLTEKFNSLKYFDGWISIKNKDILFQEINSFTNYHKIWEDISFSLTIDKLDDFFNLSKSIYFNILKTLSLQVFINKVENFYHEVSKKIHLIK